MLHELGEVFALERALRDCVPKPFGLFSRYPVIGRPEVKNQIVRVREIFRLVDVQLKTVNVLEISDPPRAGASPIMLAFDDFLFPALITSSVLATV